MLAESLLLNPIVLGGLPFLGVTCADHPTWAVTFRAAKVSLHDLLGVYREHLIDQHDGKGVLAEAGAEADSRIQDY